MTKDSLRAELEKQVERFQSAQGGEVVTYAAQHVPDRKPWRKKPSLIDEAFQKELVQAEREKAERDAK